MGHSPKNSSVDFQLWLTNASGQQWHCVSMKAQTVLVFSSMCLYTYLYSTVCLAVSLYQGLNIWTTGLLYNIATILY